MRISKCFLLNHHRLLICYSVLRVAKCWIYGGCCLGIEFRMKINEVRRTVPSFKLLKDSKVYDILIRKSSTRLFCDCYQLQSLHKNTEFSRQKGVYTQCTSLCGLFVYKKREIFEPYRLEILKLWLHTQIVWAPCGVCRLALQIVTLSTSNSYTTLPLSVFISELK